MKSIKNLQLETYLRMNRIRKFEEMANELRISGEILGACHSSSGQEATAVGACMALRNDDYITGTHRSHGHPIAKGADLNILMAELLGKVTGVCKGRGGSMHLADSSVGIIKESSIVGSGIPLATGAGLSAKVRSTDQVSLCFFGDGAVNEGAFSESLNMGAIWKLPVIYFCENNLYAITTSVTRSHGQPNIAKHADSFGMPGVVVDGQDASAVYETTRIAVDRARRGEGPTLIEARTYRFDEHALGLGEHFPGRYRDQDEVEKYKTTRDPIKLYKNILLDCGISELKLLDIEKKVDEEISRAVAFARNSLFPDPTDLCEYMYSTPIRL